MESRDMACGIYTLANDAFYDQLVALLNSIEVNVNKNIPICVIPYDDRVKKVKQEIDSRGNVFLFDDNDSIQRWEDFANKVWSAHPEAKRSRLSRNRFYKSNTIRKWCAFDGPFNKFVFYDVDSLAMKPIDDVFEKLEIYDFVFDDWEHRKPDAISFLDFLLIEKASPFKKEEIRARQHGVDFFGSRSGLFPKEEVLKIKKQLVKNDEVKWLKGLGIWDEGTIFNYMTLRSGRSLFNFTQSLNGRDRTGNCANADPFVNIDNILYSQEGLKPIHRIHYMGYLPIDFALLCRGVDVNIRYKDVFLYYRFLKNPKQRPERLKQLNVLSETIREAKKAIEKLKMILK
ncbi:MAG: methionine synthase [Candidatus Omnitrophota bacterium]|nr:MAG: methionine synthase [Candidatus Omnitrophota bacterium]